MSKTKLAIVILVASAVVAAIVVFFIIPKTPPLGPVTEQEADAAYNLLQSTLVDNKFYYADFLKEQAAYVSADMSGASSVIEKKGEFLYDVTVSKTGLYTISADCTVEGNAFEGVTIETIVNGEMQFYEAATVAVPAFWRDSTKVFPTDKFGDETVPKQEMVTDMRRIDFYDNKYISDTPLLFFFNEGKNTVEINNNSSRGLLMDNIYVTPKTGIISYAEYMHLHSGAAEGGDITFDATEYVYKNSPHIQLDVGGIDTEPFDPIFKKISYIWADNAGNEVFYTINVENPGFYKISMHAIPYKTDYASFCTLRVDGTVPFAEVKSYVLMPVGSNKWSNYTLSDAQGEPYLVYLEAGQRTVSFKMEVAPVYDEIRALQLLNDHINQFALEIRKVTGKEIDKNRTWRLTRYIPETAAYLDAYDAILRDLYYKLGEYGYKGSKSADLVSLPEAVVLLGKLREKPDELPLYAERLAAFGSSAANATSVLKLCAEMMDMLTSDSGMGLDTVYLYGGEKELGRANASLWKSIAAGTQQVVSSYTSPKFSVRNRDDALNIWINDSVLFADALQKLVDTRFTPETGIDVNISVMPDANKLVLSKAASTNPDIALRLESYMPFNLASRNALYDLTNFPDFWEFSANLVPGAFTSYVFNEGVYAVPESVTFAATIYRKDIFRQLNLEPPDTWDNVCEISPTLQRYNMSFYMPIASGDGYKWFHQTSPLIYQNNGQLYQPDGLGSAIGEPNAVKGLTLLGDLFTTYALAEQVPVFSNSFRFAQTPVGIADATAYMTLKRTAPELAGQWELAPYPGTVQEDGSISRWFVGNGRGAIIFDETRASKEDCWTFLKWWLSESVQTDYAFSLSANYNALWLSSNMDALANAPIEDKDLAVMLDMVKWMRDVPRSPGQYLLERSLSDTWNKMVFDDVPAQVAIDTSLISIQREFRRKMLEFGYTDDQGNLIKPYVVHEVDWIIEKMKEAGGS